MLQISFYKNMLDKLNVFENNSNLSKFNIIKIILGNNYNSIILIKYRKVISGFRFNEHKILNGKF